MPQTSDEMQALMKKWFGDPIDPTGPHKFLLDRGWKDEAGMLRPPVPSHRASPYELKCVLFLIEEWDFGWEGMWGWNHEEFVKGELEK